MAYDHKNVDPEVRKKWDALRLYEADLADDSKPKYYLLTEFPYPSGDLHIGHWYAFAVTDIYARLLRAQGHNVLFPMGFDAFGLPAENAAIKHGVDPKEWTYENIERMRAQLASMGASFDWSKEVVTCDPSYYQWTQWLFTKLFEHGLAERKEASVKWCPKDQTVLANEQVVDGHCERCGTEVEEKVLTQWFLKITQYADRLLSGLSELPWREEIKEAQRAWIGKSDGAKIQFPISNSEFSIEVFTTRPDTIFGATYVVLAPEHSLMKDLVGLSSNKEGVGAYLEATKKKTERERSENKEKTGVRLEGLSAVNPATKEEIPVFVADYVLGSYGTGAVMAVPAHDERDFEFAHRHGLPVREVVAREYVQTVEPGIYRPDEPTQETRGIIAVVKHWSEEKYLGLKWKQVAWGTFLTGGIEEGMTPEETAIKELREETGYEHARVARTLGHVDGLFYHVPKKTNKLVHAHILLVELEDGAQHEIDPEEAAKHDLEWLSLDELVSFLTPDTHQHSLRLLKGETGAYTGPGSLVNSGDFTGKKTEVAKWEIIDWLGGNAERATQYRLRDWSVSRQRYWGCPIPIVYDPEGNPHAIPAEHLPWLLPEDVNFAPRGEASPLASSAELKERVASIFGEGWTPEYDTLDTFVDSSWYFTRYLDSKDPDKFSDTDLMQKWLPVDRYSGGSEHTTMHLLYARFFTKALFDLGLVPVDEPFAERYNRGLIMGPDGAKMSKSKGNVVNPDEFVEKYGSDAVRMYLAFIGPYNEPRSYPWSLEGVSSMRKFLERVIRLAEGSVPQAAIREATARALSRAAHKVAEESSRFKFNTAVAALMILLNELEEEKELSRDAAATVLVLLAPFAPHLADYLWQKLGMEGSVHQQPWPAFEKVVEEAAEVVVQVNGKRRGSITLAEGGSEEEAAALALALPAVSAALGEKPPQRVVYVPGKIINLVG